MIVGAEKRYTEKNYTLLAFLQGPTYLLLLEYLQECAYIHEFIQMNLKPVDLSVKQNCFFL